MPNEIIPQRPHHPDTINGKELSRLLFRMLLAHLLISLVLLAFLLWWVLWILNGR